MIRELFREAFTSTKGRGGFDRATIWSARSTVAASIAAVCQCLALVLFVVTR